MAAPRGRRNLLPQAACCRLISRICWKCWSHFGNLRKTELAEAAKETLESQTPDDLLTAAKSVDTPAAVLDYVATSPRADREIYEAVILNKNTSDQAVAGLAAATSDSSLLDLIAINQQRLVRFPAIIDAILANSDRSIEAERRARETKREFFEKERGAQQIAEELRARERAPRQSFSRLLISLSR